MASSTVSLGLQLCGSIATYVEALNCRKENIASVLQQNESLRKTLEFAESSLSLFQHDHHAAATTAHECLNSCNKELVELQRLVARFTASDQPANGWRGNMKNQGNKLLYPFSRAKVDELETRIRNANATLQVALQALGLYAIRICVPYFFISSLTMS